MLLFCLTNVYNSITDTRKTATVPPEQPFQVLLCYTIVINEHMLFN